LFDDIFKNKSAITKAVGYSRNCGAVAAETAHDLRVYQRGQPIRSR
jgi:hypothetical protein